MFIARYKLVSSSRNFIYLLFGALLQAVVPQLCDANVRAMRRRTDQNNSTELGRNNSSEIDTIFTSLTLLLCIVGIFLCIWCTCCSHQDFFASIDQRRLVFRQQAEQRATHRRRGSKRRKRKYLASKKETRIPVTVI